MGIIRSGYRAAKFVQRQRAGLDARSAKVSYKTLGGTKRLDARRPDPYHPLNKGLIGLGHTVFLLVLINPFILAVFPDLPSVPLLGFFFMLPLPAIPTGFLEPLLVLEVYLLARFIARCSREHPSGILTFWKGMLKDLNCVAALTPILLTTVLVIRLLAIGFPGAVGKFFFDVGTLLSVAGCIAAAIAGVSLGLAFNRMRSDEYLTTEGWEARLRKIGVKEGLSTLEMHKAFQLKPGGARIYPVPIGHQDLFPSIEARLIAGRIDDVMLSDDSASDDWHLDPITPECLEQRETLRDSKGTLTGFDPREVEDEEILGRSVVVSPDSVNPEAVSPPKPQVAFAAEEVTVKSLPQIQRFALDKGMTIVGVDLHRFNTEKRRYENLIYVQQVSKPEKAILQRISTQLKCEPWDMWLECNWVDNDEDDRDAHPQRIDSVVVKRSPVRGISAEKREEIWRPVIDMFPKGSNGWIIEDDQQSGFVTLRYGKPRKLPGFTPYDWDLPFSHQFVPFGISETDEVVNINILESNVILGGTPGGGKSGGMTAILAGVCRLENTAIVGFDPKEVEQIPWESRFSHTAITLDESTRLLGLLADEMDRRYTVLRKITQSTGKVKKKVTPDLFEQMPLIVIPIDELAELVAMGSDKEEMDGDKLRIKYIQRLIQKGRAAGIAVIGATQKPHSDVIPTRVRDLTQQRVAYATTNSDMTDTILGKGMSGNGGKSEEISGNDKGACYVINESSRTPQHVRTFLIPDEDVMAISDKYAHLRVHLPFLDEGYEPSVVLGEDEEGVIEREPTTPAATESNKSVKELFGFELYE